MSFSRGELGYCAIDPFRDLGLGDRVCWSGMLQFGFENGIAGRRKVQRRLGLKQLTGKFVELGGKLAGLDRFLNNDAV